MAPSPLANDPGERYAELERAYTEDRWPDVLEQGGQLIADLSNDPDPVTADLASRAQLLLGHAHLYGLRDPAAALPHYEAVLAGPTDPDLRRIAEEALPYCQPPVATAAPPAEELTADAVAPESAKHLATAELFTTLSAAEATADAAAVAQERSPWAVIEPTAEPLGDQSLAAEGHWIPRSGTATEAITGAATPWLDEPISLENTISLDQPSQTEVGGMLAAPGTSVEELVPSLEVEVVEEPELVEVAQADPSLAEELEIELTRIRERRAADRRDGAATLEMATPTPAPAPVLEELQEPDDLNELMEDPELLAGLLRVMVTP
jgi:hypothetical protein